MISFIVPAHNEEACLPATIEAIHRSAQAAGEPYEVVVVDDASTDATEETARQRGAKVIKANHRQIAATRNSGARAAEGDRFFFVDADTTVNSAAIQSALRWMDKGAAGGGAMTRFEGSVPLYAKLLSEGFGLFMRAASMSGGAFMFCTREAFNAVGGFDERLYGAEDAAMSAALKKEGRFVVLKERLFTSGRRVRALSGLKILLLLARVAFVPSHLTRRSAVEKVWYNSDRSGDGAVSHSVADRISNGVALLVLLAMAMLPVWIVPWPQALLDSPLGALKSGARIILAHAGLALWPCAVFFARSLLQQKRQVEKIKLAVLIILSTGFAFHASGRVWEFWAKLIP